VVITGMIGIGVVGFAIDIALRGLEAWFCRRWGQDT
ncbi:MAG: ABC transporter permease, partial [Rhodospirillales bacterium]|nr:ABC transporter permease [Rhodospirillales bacterium]